MADATENAVLRASNGLYRRDCSSTERRLYALAGTRLIGYARWSTRNLPRFRRALGLGAVCSLIYLM